MPTARLIIDPPAEGSWNMAVDEALLESAADSGEITLRFYEWSPATLSLGYFQSHEERSGHTASLACPMVRRSTGGGAIVHDQELTYSLVVPMDGRSHSAATAMYDAMHDSLVLALADFGLQASRYQSPPVVGIDAPLQAEPFLCFQRRAIGDVIIGGHKVGGSAQRRHSTTVLQHGSVLLRKSVSAPELPGIAELGCDISVPQLVERWLAKAQSHLGLRFDNSTLREPEAELARKVQIVKYQSLCWTRKR